MNALQWPQEKFVWSFFPFFFPLVCLVSICFFPKMNLFLYNSPKSYMCAFWVRAECLFSPMWLNKGERKLVASSITSPQGRRLTFDKMSALLKSPSKSRCRFHQGLIFEIHVAYSANFSLDFSHSSQRIHLEKIAKQSFPIHLCSWMSRPVKGLR